MTNIDECIEKIRKREITDKELELLLIDIYRFLDSDIEDDYKSCLSAICYIADLKITDKLILQLLHDCITKSRIFLYDDLLSKVNNKFNPHISFQDTVSRSFYTSRKTNTVLTKPQKEVLDLFQKYRRLVVSAPTSFGKTRIIREIIAHNNFKNIVLIMPTVSLLSEQFQDLKSNIDGYLISKSSKVVIDDSKKYILILTPERMNVFMEENPDFKVDFFVMDEIYKIDFKLDDDRFKIFSDILYKLANSKADFYLIGPYISSFSEKFRSKFDIHMKKFNLEIVQKEYFNLDNHLGNKICVVEQNSIHVVQDRFKNLLRILAAESITGKFLIYRQTKQLVEETATKLSDMWPVKNYNKELVNYLSEVVSPDWSLVSCMKRGVAFHHGAMPRYIQDLVVDEFNKTTNDGVNYLFCTTSLTEGVNTSAKNVVLFDKKIGTTTMKDLDRKNIEGRAGRFMKHFVGRVFHLQDPEISENNTNVEIEYIDSPQPSIETLTQIEDSDLESKCLEEKNTLKEKLTHLNIPFELIKNNKFINIDGQIKLIQYLREINIDDFRGIFFRVGLPNIEISKKIMNLIYENLFTEHDKGRNFDTEFGKKMLIQLTNFYMYHTPSFFELLNSSATQWMRGNINSRIRYIFDLYSKYFEFVWPRYFKAFENIYNFAAKEKREEEISLDMAISKLEYGTTVNHEIILRDAGLPNQIIQKVSQYFDGCESFEQIQTKKNENIKQISSSIGEVENIILNKYL